MQNPSLSERHRFLARVLLAPTVIRQLTANHLGTCLVFKELVLQGFFAGVGSCSVKALLVVLETKIRTSASVKIYSRTENQKRF